MVRYQTSPELLNEKTSVLRAFPTHSSPIVAKIHLTLNNVEHDMKSDTNPNPRELSRGHR